MLERLGRLYFQHDLQDRMKELYASIAIRDFAVSMISIFEPIYLYKTYGSLRVVFLFYAVLYSVYFFAIPLGAKAAARYGFGHCISASVVFALLYYMVLGRLQNMPELIVLAVILAVIDKALLRPAYHASMAHYGQSGFRGREVGGLSFLESLASMTGPLVGGIILATQGFSFLFVIVALLVLLSMLPVISNKEEFTPQDFSYWAAMQRFFKPQENYRKEDSLAYMGYGEELIAASFWPVFIFLFLAQFHIIGLLATSASVLVAVIKLYFGNLSDKFDKEAKKKWVQLNAVFYAAANFSRPFTSSWTGIFFINFSTETLKAGIVHPFFTYVYSAAGKNKDFLKYGTFYEMSLAFGKAIVGILVFTLSFYFVGFEFWFIIFILAGLWSMFFTFLKF